MNIPTFFPKKAIVLFGHGARNPVWAEPMQHLQSILQSSLPKGTLVELAFLELMAPDLPTQVANLARQGATHIRVVPVFFGKGGHVQQDLPVLMEELGCLHPQLTIEATEPVGSWDEVWQAIAKKIIGSMDTQ